MTGPILTILTAALFAVFFFCVLGQFFVARRLRRALVANHPDIWRELSDKAWFVDNAVFRFALSRRVKDLNDPDLSGLARKARRLQIATFVALFAYAATLILLTG